MAAKSNTKGASGDKATAGKDDKNDKAGGNGAVARWIGIGAGIGSAAVAAAVLYANRDWLKSKAEKAEKAVKPSRLAEDAVD